MFRFERDLKQKLEMKCPPTQEETTFLTKTFKFFDIQNKGSVTEEQFGRAIQKIGVVLSDEIVSTPIAFVSDFALCAELGRLVQLLRQEWRWQN